MTNSAELPDIDSKNILGLEKQLIWSFWWVSGYSIIDGPDGTQLFDLDFPIDFFSFLCNIVNGIVNFGSL